MNRKSRHQAEAKNVCTAKIYIDDCMSRPTQLLLNNPFICLSSFTYNHFRSWLINLVVSLIRCQRRKMQQKDWTPCHQSM